MKSTVVLTGTFEGSGDGIHEAKGLASIIRLEDRNQLLQLNDFKSTRGPNLHILLSPNKEIIDTVEIGKLKLNEGNQTYDVPSETDLTKYNTVLIWCKDFSILFGSAKMHTSNQ